MALFVGIHVMWDLVVFPVYRSSLQSVSSDDVSTWVSSTRHTPPPPGCKLIFAKCFCPGGPPESPSSLWEQFLQVWGGAVQSAARHGPRFYPKPWDGSLVFVKSVLPGVKSKTKEWGIKWESLGGFVCHIVCLHPHPLCRNDPAWQRKSPRLWSELVKARVCTCVCMHVCKLNMHTCLCVFLLQMCVLGAVSRDTERSDKCIYTIYYPGQHPENTPTVI